MLSIATLVSAATIIVASKPVDSWPGLVSNEGRFTVKMPGPVDERVRKVETDLAALDEYTFTCQAGTAFYRVSYVDLPPKFGATRADTLLITAQDASRPDPKALLYAEGSGSSNGVVWRRFRVQASRGPVVSHYLAVKASRFYHLEVVAPPTAWRRAKAKDFFDSFALSED